MTYSSFLKRALVAGAVGGVAFALFLWGVGERSIRSALAFEESLSGGEEAGHHDELYTRGTQVLGGMLAGVLYGLVVALIFVTVFVAVRHRLRGLDDMHRSLWLAFAAFVATALLPAIKYPANPPGLGDPDTISERTIAYLTFLAACIVLCVLVALLNSRLRASVDDATRLVITSVAAFAGAVLLVVVWPDTNDPLPAGVAASLVWRFRLESLGGLALFWAVFALGFGWLCHRAEARAPLPVMT